jgi:hypothetical protein
MQRKMAPYAITASVVLALGVLAAGGSFIPAHEAHAAGRPDQVAEA